MGLNGYLTLPRVFNYHHKDYPDHAVFIGRPSKWGNPFIIGTDGTREQVLEKYSRWLDERIRSRHLDPRELRGKPLLCYCSPLPCHGDILLNLANQGEAK